MYAKRNGAAASPQWTGSPRTTGSLMKFENISGGYPMDGRMQMEISAVKQENINLQSMLYDVQTSRDKLRNTVQKLRVENGRLKLKIKRVGDAAKAGDGKAINLDDLNDEIDFDSLKEFLLIGGIKDPLDVSFPIPVKDREGRQYKTGERYLWFKMAEHFGDNPSAMQFLTVNDDKKAQEIVEKVKNFDQAAWDGIKMKHFEEYQRLKFEQNRPLRCLLLKTAPLYLAVASQDKTYGTGWRKQRAEAERPKMWDGENLGGKLLMKLRDEFLANHSWVSPGEEEEAKKQFDENKRSVWQGSRRPQSSTTTRSPNRKRGGGGPAVRGGGRGAMRGNRSGVPPSFYGADTFGSASYYGGDGYTSFSAPMASFGVAMRNGGGGPPFKRRR